MAQIPAPPIAIGVVSANRYEDTFYKTTAVKDYDGNPVDLSTLFDLRTVVYDNSPNSKNPATSHFGAVEVTGNADGTAMLRATPAGLDTLSRIGSFVLLLRGRVLTGDADQVLGVGTLTIVNQ